jgi:hypothetical protein
MPALPASANTRLCVNPIPTEIIMAREAGRISVGEVSREGFEPSTIAVLLGLTPTSRHISADKEQPGIYTLAEPRRWYEASRDRCQNLRAALQSPAP